MTILDAQIFRVLSLSKKRGLPQNFTHVLYGHIKLAIPFNHWCACISLHIWVTNHSVHHMHFLRAKPGKVHFSLTWWWCRSQWRSCLWAAQRCSRPGSWPDRPGCWWERSPGSMEGHSPPQFSATQKIHPECTNLFLPSLHNKSDEWIMLYSWHCPLPYFLPTAERQASIHN